MGKRIRGITVEIGGNTAPLDKALNGVNQNSRSLQAELRQVERLLKLDPTNTELLAQKQDLLADSISEASKKLDTLRGAQAQVEAQFQNGEIGEEQYRAFQREIIQTEASLRDISRDMQAAGRNLNEFGDNNGVAREAAARLNRELSEQRDALEADRRASEAAREAQEAHTREVQEAQNELDEFTSKASAAGDKVKDFGSKLLGLGAAGIGAAGYAVKLSDEFDSAFNTLITKTGATKEEWDSLNTAMENVYKNNFGESIEDVAQAMATVQQQTKMSGEELQKTTENALLMRDTFDFDVNESIRSVKMMMEQFGVSSDVAYSMIAQGAQSGLDKNGDLLDTINEYSVHFAQLGIGAEDMFNMLVNGADGGTFSVDKLGDAVKEFGIKMKDGSANEAFKALGLDAKKTTEMFGEGGEKAQAAMQIIGEKLFALDDPIKQNQLGVMMFGTMWEDLGVDGVRSLLNVQGEVKATTDALDTINKQKYDSIGSALQGLGRELQVDVVEPLGEKLKPVVEDVISYVKEHAPDIKKTVSDLTDKIGQMIAFIVDNSGSIISALGAIGVAFLVFKIGSLILTVVSAFKAFKTATDGATLAMVLFTKAGKANVFVLLASLIAGVITALIALYHNNDKFRNSVNAVWTAVKGFIASAVVAIIAKFKAIQKGIDDMVGWFQKLPERIQTYISNVITRITKWATDLGTKATNAATKFVTNIVDGVKSLPSKFWNWLKNTIIKVNEWHQNLVNKASSAAKSFVSNVINGVKSLPGKVWTWLKNTISKVNEWHSQMVKKALSAGKKLVTSVVDSVKNLPGKIKEVGSNVVEGLWNGINNKTDWVISKVKSFGSSIIKGIKEFFGIHSPSRKMRDEVGQYISAGVAEGIDKGSKKAVDATKKMGSKVAEQAKKDAEKAKKEAAKADKARAARYKKDVDNLDLKVAKERLSAEKQMQLWDKLRIKYADGTKERTAADKKYYAARDKAEAEAEKKAQERLEKDKKRLDDRKVYEDVTIKQEMEYWEKARKKYKKNSEERLEADKMYKEAKTSLADQIASAEETYAQNCKQVNDDLKANIQSLTDEYNNSVKARTEAIVSSTGLFDEFTKNTEVSGEQLLKNLQGQVTGITDWTMSLDQMKERGVADGLIEELQEMGPKSTGEIQALLSLTDQQLNEYVALWGTKSALAKEQATKELAGTKIETEGKIKDLTKQANEDLKGYAKAYAEAMKEIGVTVKQPIETLKATVAEDGKIVVKAFTSAVKVKASGKKSKKAVESVNTLVEESLSTLPAKAQGIGSNTVSGIIIGIESQIPALEAAVNRIIMLALQAMQAKAEIHSPSRLFAAKIGEPLAQGVSVGFENEMSKNKLFDSVPTFLDRKISMASSNSGIIAAIGASGGGNIQIDIHTQSVDRQSIPFLVNEMNKLLGKKL